MSGRIRTIKPELLEDAVSAGLSANAFRLYVGSFLLADDHGNFRAEPRKLLGDVFWARAEVTASDVASFLGELALAGASQERTGLLQPYLVRGQLYAHIRNWEKHQKIDHKGNPRVSTPDSPEATPFPLDGLFSRDPRESVPRLSLLTTTTISTNDHDQDTPFAGSGEPTSVPSNPISEHPPESVTRILTQPRQPSLPALQPGAAQAASASDADPIREVFGHWLDGWHRIAKGTREPKLDEKRRGKIRARLREGFTAEDLKRAIDGMWVTPWNVENKFWDIELVCRDASKVERFMATAPDRRRAVGGLSDRAELGILPEPKILTKPAELEAPEAETLDEMLGESGVHKIAVRGAL